MRVYQYDKNGYYQGEAEHPGGPLPLNSTAAEPSVTAGYIPRWDNGAWAQVEDHRGAKGYVNGEPTEIRDIGPLPDGWSETSPEPALADVKAAKIAEIASELDAIDLKLARPTQAIVEALMNTLTPPPQDVIKFEELQARKTELRGLIAQVNAATGVEEAEAIQW